MKIIIACRNDYPGMCERSQWCRINFGNSAAYLSSVSSRARWHVLHVSIDNSIHPEFQYEYRFFNDDDATLFQLTWC